MDDEAAFIETIRLHANDDTPRLIYADWLEDRGDPRAAYLRLNVQAAKLQRERDISFEPQKLKALAVSQNPCQGRYPLLNSLLDELEQLRFEADTCDAAMIRLAETIDLHWRKTVGIKHDFVITSIGPGCKARMAQAIRGTTGLSLAKAKDLIKELPCCVPVGLLREETESARTLFQYGQWKEMERDRYDDVVRYETIGVTLCDVAVRVRT